MSDMREETEDEISLLDLAITIKENIKLLVLAPLAAGVVAMMVALLVIGIFSFQRLGLDQYPDVDVPIVVVMTTYSGATPETVETAGVIGTGVQARLQMRAAHLVRPF